MRIAGYLQTSLIDWPGKIASVVFVPGCNLRCPWCHNADLVDPLKNRRLMPIREGQILTDLGKRKKWVDGVVITGGEPTLQKDLANFIRAVRGQGFGVKLDTNGARPEIIKKLLTEGLLNYVAIDYKGDKKIYKLCGGRGDFVGEEIRESLRALLEGTVEFEIRTTVVPTIHSRRVLIKMAQYLRLILKRFPSSANSQWFWQNFQPKNCLNPVFEKIRPFKKEELESLREAVRKIIPSVELRGI